MLEMSRTLRKAKLAWMSNDVSTNKAKKSEEKRSRVIIKELGNERRPRPHGGGATMSQVVSN